MKINSLSNTELKQGDTASVTTATLSPEPGERVAFIPADVTVVLQKGNVERTFDATIVDMGAHTLVEFQITDYKTMTEGSYTVKIVAHYHTPEGQATMVATGDAKLTILQSLYAQQNY